MMLRRSLVTLLGASLLLVGCGGDDIPSKADFISQVKKSMGSDLDKSLARAGIDTDKAKATIDGFFGCVYDKIKDNKDLLDKAYAEAGDASVQRELEKKAASCSDKLTDAMSGSTGG